MHAAISSQPEPPPYVVVPHDPAWPAVFAREQALLARAFAAERIGGGVAIQHMGSTAVPGLAAKPIVDLLVGVEPFLQVAAYVRALALAGYARIERSGDAERHAFRKEGVEGSGVQVVHAHICARGGVVYRRALLFRDYLRAHPDTARKYAALKQRLAQAFPFNEGFGYSDGKRQFCHAVIAAAEAWAFERGRTRS